MNTPIGQFATSSTNQFGTGKILAISANTVTIQYFASPALHSFHSYETSRKSVSSSPLSSNARVYCLDEDSKRWQAGRVLSRTEDGQYYVGFPNDKRGKFSPSQVFVRWRLPVEAPLDYLVARINETPYWQQGRIQLTRSLVEQRRAYRGLSSLASSSVELLLHQFLMVRRVLRDPVQRYLLADEVGLGKTIEVGLILKQYLLDYPQEEKAVLVLVPEHLISQWTKELCSKFHLEHLLGTRIHVLAHQSKEITDLQQNLGMLIIDEAHQVSRFAFNKGSRFDADYEVIRKIAAATPRVFLMSATPVLRNEDGFLAMLHLIDPSVFSLSDREGFRRLVQNRQKIAEQFNSLQDDAEAYFLGESINELVALSPQDGRLQELCSRLQELLDKEVGDESRIRAVRELRTHLAEAYRLHRRLLRTRRDNPQIANDLPKRDGVEVCFHFCEAREGVASFLESWRVQALHQTSSSKNKERFEELAELFAGVVEAALSHPALLHSLVKARCEEQSCLEGGWVGFENVVELWRKLGETFEGELSWLKGQVAALHQNPAEDQRLTALFQLLNKREYLGFKVVIFADQPKVADAIADYLRPKMSSVARFLSGEVVPNTSIIVCDRLAEEGLNLQGKKSLVVHYDLPLNPNRLEQRTGRLDRIGARGNIKSACFVGDVNATGLRSEHTWATCLDTAVGVFSRSVAALQYAIDEEITLLRASLLEEGQQAITAASARFQDDKKGLAREFKRLRAQDALDAVDSFTAEEQQVFHDLEKYELGGEDDNSEAESKFQRAFHSWVLERLQFRKFSERDQSGQFRYMLTDDTLLSSQDFVYYATDAIDLDVSIKAKLPTTNPATFDRFDAVRFGRRLYRIGHPFIEAVAKLLRNDDRGVAFALWRYMKNYTGTSTSLYFRFDFVVEANPDPIVALAKVRPDISENALRRRADDAFAPHFQTVWIDQDGEVVTDGPLLDILGLEYDKKWGAGSDINLNESRWPVVEKMGLLGNWDSSCKGAFVAAARHLREATNLHEICKNRASHVQQEGEEIAAQLLSRISRLIGTAKHGEENVLSIERASAEALSSCILEPSVLLDSVGAIFLSNQNPFAGDKGR